MSTSKFTKDLEIKSELSDLSYLSRIMNGKKHLIYGMLDFFLKNFPMEIQSINLAITAKDYTKIESIAHTMQSSVSIVGISTLTPILKEIEELAINQVIDKIKVLKRKLNLIANQSIKELENKKPNFI